MSGHAEGPWAYDQNDVGVTIRDPRGVAIAEVWLRGFPDAERATGRLIAAAPELLAALQGLLADELHTREKWDAARDAVEKATQP